MNMLTGLLLFASSLFSPVFVWARPPVDLVLSNKKPVSKRIKESELSYQKKSEVEVEVVLTKSSYLYLRPNEKQKSKSRLEKGTRVKFLKVSKNGKWSMISTLDGSIEGWVRVNVLGRLNADGIGGPKKSK